MSLVDYAYSDDEDTEITEAEKGEPELSRENPSTIPLPQSRVGVTPNQQSESASRPSMPFMEKLPDASFLLNSPLGSSHMGSSSDHSSRVAAAVAESASRKRDANGLSSLPHNKLPRGTLPHSRNYPDTVGGLLVPPQLKGRSNVVTEDMSKLFVKRHSVP